LFFKISPTDINGSTSRNNFKSWGKIKKRVN
jgi:hypothetical protein